jgi:hypothetical protein
VEIDLVRLLVFPVVGFLAGFAAQWLLQARRSRDELVRALEELVSALRTRLKYDSGIYERAETRRQLRRPRPSPWE